MNMMPTNNSYPSKLYRYDEARWLESALRFGEFLIRPASHYERLEGDHARQDDERIRVRSSPAEKVQITRVSNGEKIDPIGDVTFQSKITTDYMMLCFSERWSVKLFSEFPPSDACLVIHDVEKFVERLHAAMEVILRKWTGIDWAGIDSRVTYGGNSSLGVVFSKPLHFIDQQEWRFAWCPERPFKKLNSLKIRMGSIEQIAEIVKRPPSENNLYE